MDDEKIRLQMQDQVAVITLCDPAVMNALSPQLLSEFRSAINHLNAEKSARCLLLKGEGRGFCSGANLATGMDAAGEVFSFSRSLREHYHPLLLALRDLSIPIIAAVHGAAAGAGVGVALSADIICASKDAYFLQAFGRIGLAPDAGTSYLLPRLIGWSRAVELSLLTDKLYAEQAQEWGLVNRLFDDHAALGAGAMELAQRLAQGPKSLGLMRRLFHETWSNDYATQLELEAQVQELAGATQDAKEGIAAFREKRKAQFTGH